MQAIIWRGYWLQEKHEDTILGYREEDINSTVSLNITRTSDLAIASYTEYPNAQVPDAKRARRRTDNLDLGRNAVFLPEECLIIPSPPSSPSSP